MQATATIKTAPVMANWAVVPQIPSGKANNKARPTAMPPACAVETRFALKSAQQGPTMSRVIRVTRDPRSESAAVMSNMMTMLNLKKNRPGRSAIKGEHSAVTSVMLSPRCSWQKGGVLCATCAETGYLRAAVVDGVIHLCTDRFVENVEVGVGANSNPRDIDVVAAFRSDGAVSRPDLRRASMQIRSSIDDHLCAPRTVEIPGANRTRCAW